MSSCAVFFFYQDHALVTEIKTNTETEAVHTLPTKLELNTPINKRVVQILPTELKHNGDREINKTRSFAEGSKIAQCVCTCNIVNATQNRIEDTRAVHERIN